MAVIEELPFAIYLSAEQPYATLPLPHCATRFPVGLRIAHADDGILICDLKWSSTSQFAASGNVDPKLLKETLRMRFHPPKFPKDPHICVGNISRKSCNLAGVMLVADKYTPPPVYILPFNPLQPGHPYPWQYDIQPGLNRATAHSQVRGRLKELVLQQPHIDLIRSGDLELNVQSIRYLHPKLKRNVITEFHEIGFTLSSIDRLVFEPNVVPESHEICITFKNNTKEVFSRFSCVATIEAED